MNKTKRTAAVILSVLAMCAAMLAGCSESSSKSTSSSKPDSSEQNTSSQSESATASETTTSTSASQETTTTATTSPPEETTSETSASSQQTQQAAAATTAAQGTPVSKADLKTASQAAAKQSNETANQAGWSVVDEGEVINKDTEYGYWVYYHIDKNHNGQPSDFVGIWKSTINKKGELETQLYIPMMGEDKNKLESFTVNYSKDSGLELIKKMGK